MTPLDELHAALLKADAAGDTQSAKLLADHIRALPQQQSAPNSQVGGDDPIMAALSGKAASAPQQPAAQDDPIMAALSSKQPAQPRPIAPPAPQQPSQPPTLGGELLRQVGLTARAGVTGLAGIPNMLGDAANSLINMGTSGINKVAGTNIPQLQLPSQATQELMTKAGVPEPKNALERGVQAVTGGMAGVPTSVALGKLLSGAVSPTVSAIGNGLMQAPGMQVLGSAGAGAGGSIAAENGGGLAAQLGASLLGGLTGVGAGTAASAIRNRLTTPSQAEMLAQALRDQARNAAPEAGAKPHLKLNVDGTVTQTVGAAPSIAEQLGQALSDQAAGKPRIKIHVDGTQTEVPPTAAPTIGATAPAAAPQTFIAPPAAPIPDAGSPRTQLPVDRQLANIETMKQIGLNEQRPSAITGDKFTAGQEFDTAKLNNSMGEVARAQLQKEQAAIKGYANGIIEDTGAPVSTPEASGQAIRAPMQALSDHLDNQVKQVYALADERAGGAANVQLDGLGKMLNTNSMFAGKAENNTLRRGIRAYMKEQGITADGDMQPIDVKAAEGLRQYLNSQWSPQNSGLIGKIKQALDFDVTQSAGEDIYAQARAIHANRANTLDNPNGIAKLLNIDGPGGVNQAIPDEQVGTKLLGMPTSQFKHIVDTINNLPPEIQPHGQAALAEIKAAFARKIYAAGDTGGTQNGPSIWNAANVTRELNRQSSKMRLVFSPDELAKFQTLHDAGHILQTPSAYKGAAAQGYNYLQSGAITALPGAGAGIGALFGGPIGAAVGGGIGGAAATVAKKGVDSSMARKYAEILRNPGPQFIKK